MLRSLDFFRFMLDIPDYIIINLHHEIFDPADNAVGYCGQEDEHEYNITISSKIVRHSDLTYYLETLAHELKHVQQYITGKMVDGPLNIIYWEGEPFICWDENYSDRPWEREAFAAQRELTLEYLAYLKAH